MRNDTISNSRNVISSLSKGGQGGRVKMFIDLQIASATNVTTNVEHRTPTPNIECDALLPERRMRVHESLLRRSSAAQPRVARTAAMSGGQGYPGYDHTTSTTNPERVALNGIRTFHRTRRPRHHHTPADCFSWFTNPKRPARPAQPFQGSRAVFDDLQPRVSRRRRETLGCAAKRLRRNSLTRTRTPIL